MWNIVDVPIESSKPEDKFKIILVICPFFFIEYDQYQDQVVNSLPNFMMLYHNLPW